MVTPYEAAASVVDPEIRSITIAELGMLREVHHDPESGHVTVTISPTYAGCPAMDLIRGEIVRTLAAAGYPQASVRTVLSPAWSTDMVTESGRAKLAAAGIAPPHSVSTRLTLAPIVRCPRCGHPHTEEISRFGSTPCKALRRCRSCAEPFEQVKTL